MSAPELSVVCRNCGSEVSPYVTECPYCGQRLRKRAPKLQREGDEIKMREGRREKRLRRDAERRSRTEARLREGKGRFEELATRPVATVALLTAFAVVFIVYRASDLAVTDLGAIVGPPGDEFWRYLTAPFFFEDAGYLFACGLAVALFLPPVERRIGSLPALLMAIACGALGMLAAAGIDSALGDDFPVAAGANGIALGALAAYVVMREPERRADPDEGYDPIAVAVAAVVLLALPLVEDFADPWAALAGALVGALCGLSAARGGRTQDV
jgi:membrane associated rhomboid family serine protease